MPATSQPARTKPRFFDIPCERRSNVTEEKKSSIRGGLTAEEYRWKLIRLPNCMQIDSIAHVTPVALRRLVFGENLAQSAIELIRSPLEVAAIGVNRAKGAFSFETRGRSGRSRMHDPRLARGGPV